MESKTSFMRDATGLVRSFTWYDALIVSLAVTGPTYFGIASQIGYIAPSDPGSNFTTSAIFGVLFMIPLGVMYYVFATQMPRSGGDYIWMGRALHPSVGFVAGWAMWLSFIALLAGGAGAWGAVVVPDFALTMGYTWHNVGLINWAGTFATPNDIFAAGMLGVIIFGVIITSLGNRIYSRIMVALGIFIMLGTLIVVGFLIATSNSAFAADFTNYFTSTPGAPTATYNGVLSAAASNNFPYLPITESATLLSIPFGVLLFNGFNYSVYISGEVKNAKYSMLWGVLIALAICAAIDITGLYFAMNMLSYQFNQAAFSLFGASKFSLGVSPWLAVFVPAILGNAYLATFVQLGFLVFFPWWACGLVLSASRYVFAFSFDRILPQTFADINSRLHIPIKATVLTLAVGTILMLFTAYTSYIGEVLNTTTIWSIVWIVVGISAIVMPIRRKDLSKGLAGGARLLQVFGALSVIAMAVTFYFAVTTPAVGPSTPIADALLACIFGSGVIIYIARYYYFKSKGIDLGSVLKEIPPE
ncbi:MAG: APC family permease [Nitrososphaerota archaeon]|nr:APC family permease [Nitrososphaerota archaeon]